MAEPAGRSDDAASDESGRLDAGGDTSDSDSAESPDAPDAPDASPEAEVLTTGRIRRARRLGGVGARAGTGLSLSGLRMLGRSEERKAELLGEFHARNAQNLRRVLGQMKGAAAKLGQMASFIEPGTIPPEYAEMYHEILAELRDAVPSMSVTQIREVFEADHGGPPEAVFEDFESQPCAAASIGQVHRARLFDGTRVVIKVQYPGIDDAVRADLRNAKAFLWMVPLFAPGMDANAVMVEMERALEDELDYAREAANQQRFAELYRGHPFIVVPDVIPELCGKHTLVLEDVEGESFGWLSEQDQKTRDRAAEIIFRYGFGTLDRFGFFNADTHPGNYAFTHDAGGDLQVIFYDYGAVKTVDPQAWANFMDLTRLLLEGDIDGLFELCVATGFVPRPEKVDPQRLYDYLELSTLSIMGRDAPVTVTPELVSEIVAASNDPRGEWQSLIRWLNVHPESLLIGRLQIGLISIFAKLHATANWHRIVREWLYDAPPSTDLGAADAAFFDGCT